jgi:multisubunit Na+/H+ antiporter MnhC subunit
LEVLLASGVGALTAAGVYLLLRKRTFPVVLGLALLSYATNVFLFSMGRLAVNLPPVINDLSQAYTDPLPQALVLTAIVIGFSLFIFALALLKRTRELHGDNSTDSISSVTEQPAPDWPASEHENAKIASEHAEPRS